jgi:hypothetical protein
MKNLFEHTAVVEIEGRLTHLRSDSTRVWGKMNAGQMLAHCSGWMDMASGIDNQPRVFIGRIFGRLAKSSILKEEPIRRNMPTDKSLVRTGGHDFEMERAGLLEKIHSFASGGPERCTKHPHVFFGTMTPEEWATMGYKHLDHHLRQFGV